VALGVNSRWLTLFLLLVVLLGFLGYQGWWYWRVTSQYHAAEQALERRDFSQANSHLKRYLALFPGDLNARLLAAQVARRQGDFQEAFEHLRIYGHKNGPKDPLEWERRLLRIQQGDPSEAPLLVSFCASHPEAPETPLTLEACIEGILTALTPGSTSASSGPGEAKPYLKLGQQAVDQWLHLRPGQADQVQGLVWRSRLDALAHDRLRALADVRQALEMAPDHFEAQLHLASLLLDEEPAEAARYLQQLQARDPKNNRVRLALGVARRSLGQHQEARQILDELLADDPENLPALIERGQVALDMRQPQEAERWLHRAYTLSPQEPKVNLLLGRTLQLAGRVEEAKHFQTRYQQLEAQRERK
jgi:predicted Zn-dependent protease